MVPQVQFDVSDYLIPTPSRRKVNDFPKFKNHLLQEQLVLRNNFHVPIKIKGIVNQNPEFRIITANQQPFLILQPGESIEYASIELTLNLLRISQGTKYISVIVNNTLIPISIAIYDRGLLCVWDEQEGAINLENIPFCAHGYETNFDYVAVNDAKQKHLKITNLNPVSVTIETVSKQQIDDMNIYIEKVVDRNGNQVNVISDELQNILGPKRTKRLINFVI